MPLPRGAISIVSLFWEGGLLCFLFTSTNVRDYNNPLNTIGCTNLGWEHKLR